MKLQNQSKIVKLVLCAVCTALLAVLSQISVPLPSGVPVTLQTFAVALCGYILGLKLGVVSVLVYLALGAVGVPVFAGFSGGVASFAGVTGGFLWGFLFMAVLCGLGTMQKNRILAILLGVLGMLICHLCGVIQFSLLADSPFIDSFLLVSVPYLIKDVISVALGYTLSKATQLALGKAGIAA